jgi:hypothetical protein
MLRLHNRPVWVEDVDLTCLCLGASCFMLSLQEALPCPGSGLQEAFPCPSSGLQEAHPWLSSGLQDCLGTCFSVGNGFFLQQETVEPPRGVYCRDAHSAQPHYEDFPPPTSSILLDLLPYPVCLLILLSALVSSPSGVQYAQPHYEDFSSPSSVLLDAQPYHSYFFASSLGLSNYICLRYLF